MNYLVADRYNVCKQLFLPLLWYLQIQRLQSALAQQQEQHLATIRKMKLEQNQVLLKHHELQYILQQQQ